MGGWAGGGRKHPRPISLDGERPQKLEMNLGMQLPAIKREFHLPGSSTGSNTASGPQFVIRRRSAGRTERRFLCASSTLPLTLSIPSLAFFHLDPSLDLCVPWSPFSLPPLASFYLCPQSPCFHLALAVTPECPLPWPLPKRSCPSQ